MLLRNIDKIVCPEYDPLLKSIRRVYCKGSGQISYFALCPVQLVVTCIIYTGNALELALTACIHALTLVCRNSLGPYCQSHSFIWFGKSTECNRTRPRVLWDTRPSSPNIKTKPFFCKLIFFSSH